MKDLNKQLSEAKAVFTGVSAFNLLIEYVLLQISGAIIFYVAGYSTFYSIPPVLLLTAVKAFFSVRRDDELIDEIEGKTQHLDGRLATAYEYKDSRNIIVDDLISDTEKMMDDVGYSVFTNPRETTIRFLAITVAAFIFLALTVIYFQDYIIDLGKKGLIPEMRDKVGAARDSILEAGGVWESSENLTTKDEIDKMGGQPGGPEKGKSEGPLAGEGPGTGGEANEDIYGKPDSANIWGEEMNMELHPEYGGDVEVDLKPREINPDTFTLTGAAGAQEYKDYPVEQEGLVRRYFERLMED